MTELTKKYNEYLEQFEMLLHPNIVQGFRKIHNEIVASEVDAARRFKPSKEWLEIKKDLDRIKTGYPKELNSLLLKNIIKKIQKLPDENWE